jgi:lipoprotein NlpD
MRSAAILSLLLCCLLAACAPRWDPAEKNGAYKSSYSLTRDGHYRVRRGDTLHAIAFNFSLDWRDVAAWNNIKSPYTIYPDQELRLSPPQGSGNQQQVTRSAPSSGENTAADPNTSGHSGSSETVIRAAPAKSSSTVVADRSPGAAQTHPRPVDPGKWLWPTEGRIISNFQANDPARNGIEIGGTEGQTIVATASGEVVYSGTGLIGYGELIIIKHSDRMLSAYAHNRKRLVDEGQNVKAGDRIAEMGRNDRNKPMLHFEIRMDGTPQDPFKYLPRR